MPSPGPATVQDRAPSRRQISQGDGDCSAAELSQRPALGVAEKQPACSHLSVTGRLEGTAEHAILPLCPSGRADERHVKQPCPEGPVDLTNEYKPLVRLTRAQAEFMASPPYRNKARQLASENCSALQVTSMMLCHIRHGTSLGANVPEASNIGGSASQARRMCLDILIRDSHQFTVGRIPEDRSPIVRS